MADQVGRVVRVDDFVAEALEADAARMPGSMKMQADSFRQTAKRFRESGNPKLMRVWEDVPTSGKPDFIKPDPGYRS